MWCMRQRRIHYIFLWTLHSWNSPIQIFDLDFRKWYNRQCYSIIEWIEYKDLSNVKYFAEGGCSKIYMAIWTKGFYEKYDKEKKEFLRTGPIKRILKQLDNSYKPNKEFLNEVTFYIFIIYYINITLESNLKYKYIYIIIVKTSYFSTFQRMSRACLFWSH